MPTDADRDKTPRQELAADCPIPKTHRRLHQAHRLWHLLQGAYADPDDFVLQLNATVEGFRNVTFILQNEMEAVIPDCKAWYEGWRTRMRADPIMKWLHDSRTTVVHKGDLETHSTATVSIRANWFGPLEMGTMEVPPLIPAEAIAVMINDHLHPPPVFKREGIVEVERRWVEDGLPEHEILRALAHCFGFLWGLLSDAHTRCGIEMRDVHGGEHVVTPRAHLGYRPDCMVVEHRERTAYLHMGTGDFLTHESHEIKYDPTTGEEAEARYGLGPLLDRCKAHSEEKDGMDRDEEFLAKSALMVEIGRTMLAKDGYHVTLAFLHTPDGKRETLQLQISDQQEKYLAMEHVADRVRLLGADQLLYISEMWRAPEDPSRPDQRASESADRTEGLLFTAVTARGRAQSRQWLVPFSKGPGGETVLDGTIEMDLQLPLFLAPVFAVWAELWPGEFGEGDQKTAEGAL